MRYVFWSYFPFLNSLDNNYIFICILFVLSFVNIFFYNNAFAFVLRLLVLYNKSVIWYQVLFRFLRYYPVHVSNIIGLDGISISPVVLCSFLLLYCILVYWYLRYKIVLYCILVLSALWLLINFFASTDLLTFYVYFEGIVIPMFMLIVYEEVGVERYMQHIFFSYIHYSVQF